MALTQALINTLKAHKGDTMAVITSILNEYNSNQKPYNRLHGEDLLNAYKITGKYRTPTEIIHDNIYDDKIGRYRFGNHI